MQPLKPRLYALACPAAFLLCEWISRPWAEMGVCDDWSYIRSAQLLVETGHVHYVGWAAAAIGWQLYLAAAFIKLLGFSFSAARLPTVMIALVTAYLMQRTLVRVGIREGNAMLGTLVFVLSPLFLMLSVTMMTDVPAFFGMLACLYGCIRALRSGSDRTALLWMAAATMVNALGGTSRQVAWLGILVMVPCTLWLLRSRRRVLLYGVAMTVAGYGFVFWTLHWFNVQPYAMPEALTLAPMTLQAWTSVARQYVKGAREIALLLLPLALPYIAAVRRFSARRLVWLAGLGVAMLAFVYVLGGVAGVRSLSYPFVADWIGPHALYDGTYMVSSPPVVLGFPVLKVLSALAILAILCVAGVMLIGRPSRVEERPQGALSWYELGMLLGPVTLAYFVLLSHRSMYFIYDRYLFLPVFVALVGVLLYSQQRLTAQWRPAAYAAVAMLAFYGVLSTHNTFALYRSRVVLAEEIFAHGVPPSHVDLGWEMNGWYEPQVSTYLNDSLIVRPAGAYRKSRDPHWTGCHENFTFGLFPHLAQRYGIAFEPDRCEGPAPEFAPVSYSTWPLRKPTTLYVVRYPGPWKAERDFEISNATDGAR